MLLSRYFKPLAIFCDYTEWLLLVKPPEKKTFHDTSHLKMMLAKKHSSNNGNDQHTQKNNNNKFNLYNYGKSLICRLCGLYDMSRVVRKPALFASAKTKAQISLAVTTKLIRAFVFATRIVQSLYFLNPKFQASIYLLWLHSSIYVGPGQNPRKPVFHNEVHIRAYNQYHRYILLNAQPKNNNNLCHLSGVESG